MPSLPDAPNWEYNDITLNQEWIDKQVDRLLGFECLHKALSADPTPIPASKLADKIGVNKGYPTAVINNILPKSKHGTRKR